VTESVRAVVIGGGVGGTSIAYHLAALGWKDVVLLERADLTSIATLLRHHHERWDGTGYLDGLAGEEIPIEERDRKEVTHIKEHQLAPDGVGVRNPAFDVTPNDLINAIITDKGVARAPYVNSLQGLVGTRSAGSNG